MAAAILEALATPVDYLPVDGKGATRAAAMLADLL
jgi:hypothetical protein